MAGLIGKKLGMTSIYSPEGAVIPVTAIEAGPCKVVTIREKGKDGYEALVIGFGEKKEKHLSKPVKGLFEKAKVTPAAVLKEFKNFDTAAYKVGDDLTVTLFAEGDKVKVTAKSKGKGFQGVVKRHGFGGVGSQTHGQHNRERAPGSIGGSSWPSRVFKGTRMAGRHGYSQVTVSNLKVVKVIPEKNVILVKGAVPGAINSIIEINK